MNPLPTLQDLGEDEVVARLIRRLPLTRGVVVGAGDDCAVLYPPRGGRPWQLLKTDVVVEHVHFSSESAPADVGWKAAARAVSDIAAMGGWPTHAVVTVAAPPTTPVAWLTAVYRGLARCARRYKFSICGGETSGTPPGAPRLLNVTLLGEVDPGRCLRRAGAQPGDRWWVTGTLGGSLAHGRHLRFHPRLEEAQWLARHHRPSAMMDLSDGLATDLPRLAAASAVGWRLDLAALPRHRGCTLTQALSDGEDFELLFALSPRRTRGLVEAWHRAFPRLKLTCIGEVVEAGREEPSLGRGFEHFSQSASTDGGKAVEFPGD